MADIVSYGLCSESLLKGRNLPKGQSLSTIHCYLTAISRALFLDLVSELEAIFSRVSRAIFEPRSGVPRSPARRRSTASPNRRATACQCFFLLFCPSLTYIVMAYTVMALPLIIYTVMANIVMALPLMTYIVMAYIRARKYSPVGMWHGASCRIWFTTTCPKTLIVTLGDVLESGNANRFNLA